MRDVRNLRQFWQDRAGAPLALCTIIGKKGSGYRGLGAKKIVSRQGDSCGALSGGCLDGHIAAYAQAHWDDLPRRESFSTMSEEDRLLGYQAGCAGVIDILFERLPDIGGIDQYLPFGETPKHAGVSISLAAGSLGRRVALTSPPATEDPEAFFDPWLQPIQLCVIGGGPSAAAFAALAEPLGWSLRLLDYRRDFEGNDVAILPIKDIPAALPEGERTAVVLATHNYEADLQLVAQLQNRRFGYVGCIGPRRRFEQMKTDMPRIHGAALSPGWSEKVKAPAGLFHGRTPEDISFSIIAEIQAELGAAA